MADGVRINAEDYERFFNKTKGLSGKVRTRVRKQVRDSGRKHGREIVEGGAEKMPRRGGLQADILAKGKNPTVSLTSTGARLVLGKKKGPQLGRMNEGQLRHPVFYVWWKKGPGRDAGRARRALHAVGLSKAILSIPGDRKTWKWVAQGVAKGAWTEAAEKFLPEIRDEVAHEIDNVLKELG